MWLRNQSTLEQSYTTNLMCFSSAENGNMTELWGMMSTDPILRVLERKDLDFVMIAKVISLFMLG